MASSSAIPQSRLPAAFQSYKPDWIRQEERVGKVFGVMVVNKFGEILLVKDRRTEKWSFPKGKCKRHERELECALRELEEETSLKLSPHLQPLSIKQLRGGTYYLFALEDAPTTLTPNNTWEISEVQWWSLTALPTGMAGNIDVSLFRTCMKGLKKEVDVAPIEYLDSRACRRRMGHLRACMTSPESSPTLPPADIPVSPGGMPSNDNRWSGLKI